jgi:hypothetical protein
MGRGQWTRWGQGMCEGWSLEVGMAFHGSWFSRYGNQPTTWIASINSTGLGEFLEREIAMRRVEKLVESQHGVVLHDWELYRAEKAKTIMCGRVRLSSDYLEIKIRLKFAPNSVAPNFEPDWNKPPTAPMLVAIRSVDGERVPKMMKWGRIPHWAKDDKLQYSTFNARAEEFTTKPAFRDAWKCGQRCLVVTDGFYEWKKLDPKGQLKQPHAIAMADNTAGLEKQQRHES